MYKDDNELVPCEFMNGFFKVPGKDASVTKDGRLFHYETMRVYHSSMFPKMITENKNYAIAGVYTIHTCVAETFLEVPPGMSRDDLIVNHKDGIKSNNDLSNIEWTTHSGNIIHAYETGLRSDNVRLKARNIETGEIIEFRSMGQCAQFFRVNNNRVFGYLNRKIREAAFLNSHLLVRDNEEFPTQDEAKGWKVADNRIPVIAFNPNTKAATIYQTAADASRSIGLSVGAVNMAMNRAKKNNTYIARVKDYVIVPLTLGKDYMQYVQEDRRTDTWTRDFAPPIRTKPKVVMTELISGNITRFDDIYKMAEHFGLRHETIMRKRAANDGIYQGYKIELE